MWCRIPRTPTTGVGEVDGDVPGGVQRGGRGADRDGFPGADLTGDDPDVVLFDAPGDPGDGFGVGAVPVQHPGGEVPAERHPGEPEVRLHQFDTHCCSTPFMFGVGMSGSGSWPGTCPGSLTGDGSAVTSGSAPSTAGAAPGVPVRAWKLMACPVRPWC